jgi:hypothetical protein
MRCQYIIKHLFCNSIKNKKLFINSISNHPLKDSDFNSLLKKYEQILSNIVIEITEGSLLSDSGLFTVKSAPYFLDNLPKDHIELIREINNKRTLKVIAD